MYTRDWHQCKREVIIDPYRFRCIDILDKVPVANEDQKKGVEILRVAMQQPTRQIAENVGEDASVVVNKVTYLIILPQLRGYFCRATNGASQFLHLSSLL